MRDLIQGVHRFRNGVFRRKRHQFERLGRGQSPVALFITCSDSRVDPALLTQAEPGSLFVLRNAGNIIPAHGSGSGEEATVEFAVDRLRIRDIIVCGHSDCGAMKGLLDPEAVADLPAMARWLGHAEATRRIVRATRGRGDESRSLDAAVRENVLVQVENLITHPAVAAGLATGGLGLHAWIYTIETGEVVAFDPALRRFLPLPPDSGAPAGLPLARPAMADESAQISPDRGAGPTPRAAGTAPGRSILGPEGRHE